MPRAPNLPPRDNERLLDIAAQVYRKSLGDKAADNMLAKDADGGIKFRGRAKWLVPYVVRMMEVLGIEVPRLNGVVVTPTPRIEDDAGLFD